MDLTWLRRPSHAEKAAGGELYYWIDHTVHFATNTGMQRVARLLARSLMQRGLFPVFVCWDGRRKALRRATRSELRALARYGGPSVNPASEAYLLAGRPVSDESLEERWLLIPEVTHITYHRNPPTADLFDFAASRSLRTAWIFYDAIPLATPGYEAARRAHAAYMSELRRADMIFPISEFSGSELLSFWGEAAAARLPPVRTCALSGEFPGVERVTDYEELSGPIRILCVGSIEPRKNHLTLLPAFDRLCRENPELDVELLLMGNISGDLHGSVKRATRLNPRIRYLGYAGDDELRARYAASHFTVFPSIAEGFGLPILESIWHGKPCLCGNFGSMAEVAADGGCVTVNTHFASEIYEGLKKLATDAAFRRRLTEEAIARPIKSWLDYGTEIESHMGIVHETVRLG